jgi:hypothetical protein
MTETKVEFKPALGTRVRVKEGSAWRAGEEGEIIGEERWGARVLAKVLLDSGAIEARPFKDLEVVHLCDNPTI